MQQRSRDGSGPTCKVRTRGDNNIEVQWGKSPLTRIDSSITSCDASTNALEISFIADLYPNIADLYPNRTLTGMMSLAGPEDRYPLFLEDLIIVEEKVLKGAQVGDPLRVKHLLSSHGMNNLRSLGNKRTSIFYNPAPTLLPLVSFLRGGYKPRDIFKIALDRI